MTPLSAAEVVEIARRNKIGADMRGAFFEVASMFKPIAGMYERELAELIAERAARQRWTRPQDLLTLAGAFVRPDLVHDELVAFFRTPDMTVGEFIARLDANVGTSDAA